MQSVATKRVPSVRFPDTISSMDVPALRSLSWSAAATSVVSNFIDRSRIPSPSSSWQSQGSPSNGVPTSLRTERGPGGPSCEATLSPTPSGARWEDVSIRFTDRHSVYVTVKGASGTYHFAQMGMANKKNAKPTVQWLLLGAFAEGHGLLDWRNRKADRKNQKRKENLPADLQRFFRIDGDPFAIESDGWRVRFSVSVRGSDLYRWHAHG